MSYYDDDDRVRDRRAFRADVREGSYFFSVLLGYWWIWLLVIMLLATATGIIGTRLNWWADWQNEPYDRTGVQNVKREYSWFYENRRGLEAAASSIQGTDAKIANLKAVHGDEVAQWPAAAKIEFQSLSDAQQSQIQGYNNLCASYLARWDNEFHSSVAPPDLPRSCEYAKP